MGDQDRPEEAIITLDAINNDSKGNAIPRAPSTSAPSFSKSFKNRLQEVNGEKKKKTLVINEDPQPPVAAEMPMQTKKNSVALTLQGSLI